MSNVSRKQFVEEFFVSTQAMQRVWREQFLARLGSEQLTIGQMGVLVHVSEKQPLSSKDIAQAMYSSKSSIAQLLDSLDQQGYIIRQPDPKDRRIIYISLSKAGTDKVATLLSKRREFFTHMTESLDKDELATMAAIQTKMLQSFTAKNT